MMMFVGPGQILKGESSPEDDISGWGLLFHPDLLWGTSRANKMKKYEFFDYSVHEALFLSDKEQAVLNGIIENIKNEYYSNIDKFSQDNYRFTFGNAHEICRAFLSKTIYHKKNIQPSNSR